MIICGIDPGTAITGFGFIRKEKRSLECLDYGVIRTDKKDSAEERLNILYNQITKLLTKHKPELLVIEKLFFFKNLKTAMPVSEARGVILLAAAKKKIKVEEITPLQVKMGICGYGRADKKQVQKMVKEILKLDDIPKPDDAADALGAAVCWSRMIRC
ncbi:MAG: crossover junction endodeoxyribonuclease RuvC [Parcubacteria group bacterium]|nr:crossover junction endodeoxyribonuclease RuvC [Parcubacteria group bacterium]